MTPSLKKYAKLAMNTHGVSIMIWLPFVPIFAAIKRIADIVLFDCIRMPASILHLIGVPRSLHPNRSEPVAVRSRNSVKSMPADFCNGCTTSYFGRITPSRTAGIAVAVQAQVGAAPLDDGWDCLVPSSEANGLVTI